MAIDVGIARASANGAEICGDMARSWSGNGYDIVAIADGLGHGPDAAAAATAAMGYLDSHLDQDLVALLRGMDIALSGTRGAAIGIAVIEAASGSLAYAAVGNTRAAVFGWQAKRLDGYAGIVGGGFSRLAQTTVSIQPGTILALWTDGLEEKLALPPAAEPVEPMELLAQTLLGRFRGGSDDACVIVARFAPD